jgi:hypothetical protein
MKFKHLTIAVGSVLLLSSAATAQTTYIRRVNINSSSQPSRVTTQTSPTVRQYTPPPPTQQRTCIEYRIGDCPGTSRLYNRPGYQIQTTGRTK